MLAFLRCFSGGFLGGSAYILDVSVELLEEQIQRLPPSDLARLAEWFAGFLASCPPAGAAAGTEWQETPQLVSELERRLAEFTANPAIAVPLASDYFEDLKRQLAHERAQASPACPSGH